MRLLVASFLLRAVLAAAAVSQQRKFVLMGAAVGYNAAKIQPFVVSARLIANFTGEIVIGAKKSDLASMQVLGKRYNIRLMEMAPETLPPNVAVTVARFESFLEWTYIYAPDDILLTVDVRDTFAQDNPFRREFVANFDNTRVHLFSDFKSVGEHEINQGWLDKCYGADSWRAYAEQPIICAGNIMGTAATLRAFFRLLLQINAGLKCKGQHGTDQAIINHSVRTGLITNVHIWPQGTGPVNTVFHVTDEYWRFDKRQFLLNDDGSPSPLVHQYDRHGRLQNIYYEKIQAVTAHQQIVPRRVVPTAGVAARRTVNVRRPPTSAAVMPRRTQ